MFTFDQLPAEVHSLNQKVENLTEMVKQLLEAPKEDKLYTLEEAADKLHYTPDTLARKARAREISFTRKDRKQHFYESDIEAYLQSKRVKAL